VVGHAFCVLSNNILKARRPAHIDAKTCMHAQTDYASPVVLQQLVWAYLMSLLIPQ